MTIYVITTETQRIEFASEQVALDYAAANSLPEPVEEEKEVPTEEVVIPDVTPRQMRQALVLSGISMQQIEDALDSLSEPTKTLARIEWEYSIAFQRSRPLVSNVAAMLGWTSEQVDNLWLLAGTL